jgi:hypothetical protein
MTLRTARAYSASPRPRTWSEGLGFAGLAGTASKRYGPLAGPLSRWRLACAAA